MPAAPRPGRQPIDNRLELLLLCDDVEATARIGAALGRAPGVGEVREAAFEGDWDASGCDAVVLVLPRDAAAASTRVGQAGARAGDVARIGVSPDAAPDDLPARLPELDAWLIGAPAAPVIAEVLRLATANRRLARLASLVSPRHASRPGYDRLTGLPDREQLRDRLGGALARAGRDGRMAALALVAVDHFQRINAALGQAGGDRVLAEIARRLRGCTRQSDTVARLGSDQFALALEGLGDAGGAALAAQRTLAAVAEPLSFDGVEVRCSASIGIGIYPGVADGLDALWRQAELALQHTRESGRGRYSFYSAELDSQARSEQLRLGEIAQRIARLTPREREVMAMLVSGKANKMVAYLLGTATRTIEKHRARIMDKMQARSLAELVRMTLDAQG